MVVAQHSSLPRIFMTPRRLEIELSLSELSPEENSRWEQRLNKLRRECGCRMAAAGLLAGLAVSVSSFDASALSSVQASTVEVSSKFAIMIAFAVAGKFLGLGIARARLNHSIRALSSIATKRMSNPA